VTLLKRFGIGITNTVLKLVSHTFWKYQKTPAYELTVANLMDIYD